MAIKIDLLPGYVKLRRNLHRSIAGCIVATALVVTGLCLVYQKRQLELQTAKQNLTVMQAVAAQATAAQTEATTAQAAGAPAEGSVGFMLAASKTGPQRAALLDMVRDAINADTIVQSIDISDGQKVIIKATVRTTDEYANFLLNLRRATDTEGGLLFKGPVTAAGPLGFANGAAPFVLPTSPSGEAVPIVFPINVTAEGTLAHPISIPPDPTGANGAAATSAAGAPGGAPSTPALAPAAIPNASPAP